MVSLRDVLRIAGQADAAELSTFRARIGELEAENARLKGKAEGQTVEGGEGCCGSCPDGTCPLLQKGAAELTRLKAAQSEHDRAVRLATLEEAANEAERRAKVCFDEGNWDAQREAEYIADRIRSLIDQTGGEGGI